VKNNVNSFLTGDVDVEFISIWFWLSSSRLKYFKEASFTVLREKKKLTALARVFSFDTVA